MPNFICTTCGTQFQETANPPIECAICLDERQYLRPSGQQWTTLEKLRKSNRNSLKFKEPNLIGIGIEPAFGIGQRALFVRTPAGNILWDCISLIDEAIVEAVRALGGISAIAISHPHYYSSMVEWSRALGDVPIWLHADDQQWVMRPDKSVQFWDGETHQLNADVTLIRCGGHFAGGTVLHWKHGADGRGTLLSGDIIQVVADRKHVSFMYSYPNFTPLSAAKVSHILQTVEPYNYERVYGAFWDGVIDQHGKSIVQQSAARYIKALDS